VDSSSIELPGSEIEGGTVQGDEVRVRFGRAYIIKTMTGSVERTRWWQRGDLVLAGAQIMGDVPAFPLVCAGGDIFDNVFTYRDMVPLPLETRGRVGCDLGFRGHEGRLRVDAGQMRLEMEGVPKYIEHMRPE